MKYEGMLQFEATMELGDRVEEAILDENFPRCLNPEYWVELATTWADAVVEAVAIRVARDAYYPLTISPPGSGLDGLLADIERAGSW